MDRQQREYREAFLGVFGGEKAAPRKKKARRSPQGLTHILSDMKALSRPISRISTLEVYRKAA